MNKEQYLEALSKELQRNHVAEADDVLGDYEAHFARKALDGYTEEEIAHRLGNPVEIASDFLPDSGARGNAGKAKSRGLIRCALVGLDLLAAPVLLVMFLWAVAVGIGAAAVFALGGYLALGMSWLSFIPFITTAGGILFGLSILSLSVLMFSGTVWFWMLAGQMARAYGRWHANRWHGRHELSLPVIPQLMGKRRRNMRRVVLAALIGFVVLFAAAFAVLTAQTGTPGFWHYWHWFEAAQAN
jgi:uncharacterized membrane protein